jgi:hypothetical protein
MVYLDNIFKILILFFLESEAFGLFHKISKRDVQKKVEEDEFIVTGVKNIFACNKVADSCSPVKEFSIDKNAYPDCHEKNIKIYFDVINKSNATVRSHGYLRNGHHNSMIVSEQESKDICQKVKRLKTIFRFFKGILYLILITKTGSFFQKVFC